jgi:hypothetical protein
MKRFRRRQVLAVTGIFCAVMVVILVIAIWRPTSVEVDRKAPGQVALAAAVQTYDGHVNSALKLVSPVDRSHFRREMSHLPLNLFSEHDLQIGFVRTNGNSSNVVLTGTLCSPVRRLNQTAFTQRCLTNRLRRGAPLSFEFRLMRNEEGDWFVVGELSVG